MIKRTLYFGNPAYLSLRDKQLVIKLPEVEKLKEARESFKASAATTVPIEDIGILILDHRQITITQGVLEQLLENNVAVITCDSKRMPVGLLLPLAGNTLQTERYSYQLDATIPLKKQLWQQTVKSKIQNQARVLEAKREVDTKKMLYWADEVKAGDTENHEARAAAYFWGHAFPQYPDFRREREGIFPNSMLNYGYAIVRAVIARSLVSSGLLPTIGIFHRNKYNAYCLADDIMEPYRPVVDALVFDMVDRGLLEEEMGVEAKRELLSIPTLDVLINGRRSPLFVAATQTSASLYKCFAGEQRKISYPELIV